MNKNKIEIAPMYISIKIKARNSISKLKSIKHEPVITKIKLIIEYNEFLFKITKLAKKQFQIIRKLKNIIHYEN
jgi:hypothetical protein